ncbi:MAG: hypothetical protein KatS3mg102_1409 [Planctomycetota bacterium]|nr:MAG: hypothetical protein KatS3mg102_1409 [Planctomycetota bacterium]
MRHTRILIAGLLLAVAAGAGHQLHAPGGAGATPPPGGASAGRATEQVTAARGPFRVAVAASGRVVPRLQVEIKAKASGQIVRLPKDVSDAVEQGELLVELDPADEERLVRQARATLAASRARLVQARRNLQLAEQRLPGARRRAQAELEAAQARCAEAEAKVRREAELLARQLSSPEVYEAARTAAAQAAAELARARAALEEVALQEQALELARQDVVLAEATVESDEVALSLAERRLADTRVLAPIDGVVTARHVQVGQIISSGINNVSGGTPMLELADLSRVFVLASVDESRIGQVRVGQPASITVEAYPELRFTGAVERVAAKGTVANNVVTFEVKVEVLDPRKRLLKPEMTAQVEILVVDKDDAVLLPVQAVQRDTRGRTFVRVPQGGGAAEREVEVGLSDGGRIEVLAGLLEGEAVLLGGGQTSRWRRSSGAGGGSSGPQGEGAANALEQRRQQRAMRLILGGDRN